MNIFFLDQSFEKNAQYYVDAHTGKGLLEACQIMASAYQKGQAPYKQTHVNHPMSKWARETRENFIWTINYALALSNEFEFRRDKVHKSTEVVRWYEKNIPEFEQKGFTDPPRCFGNYIIPQTNSIFEDYKNYYRLAKSHLFKWTNREKPNWI